MALPQVQFSFDLTVMTCCNCGIQYGVPERWRLERHSDHRSWYCPNGHSLIYPAETELEKERRKSQVLADQVRMERQQREKLQQQLKRVDKGTCPKCNRHFVNVERHMKSKHK